MAALRGHDVREPGADAGHRHARGPGPGGGGLPALGGAGRGGRPGHRAARRRGRAACASSTASTARSSPTSRPSPSATTPRSTTGRWPSPATTRPGRPTTRGAGRARPTAAPDLLALLADPSWVYRQYDHQLFLNTVVGPGGDAAVLRLAAPGLPPSEQGPGPHHRLQPALVRARPPGRHRGHRGRGRPQRGLRRGPARGRGQLPQLRQPRAPRGHVAAVRGRRRHGRGLPGPRPPGHRRQRQPLQRERRRRHRPDPGRRRARPHRPAGRPPARGHPGRRRRRWSCSTPAWASPAAGAVRPRWPGRAGRWSAGATATGRCPPLDLAGHRRLVEFVAALVAEVVGGVAGGDGARCAGIHDVSGGGLGVALAELAVRSGIGLRVAGVADHHELFTEAPSRVVVCTTRPERADLAGRPRPGSASGCSGRPAGTAWWSRAWST